jgi:hypothetical protein
MADKDRYIVAQEETGYGYFDAEGERELFQSKSQDDFPLTWRGDPAENCADWTVVVVTNELKAASYHVHKNIMCFGSRASKFFSRTMLNKTPSKKRSKRQQLSTTKVELNQQDADNFPLLLDFIYAPCGKMTSGGTVLTAASTLTSPSLLPVVNEDDGSSSYTVENISTNNAVSLRHLAKKFEIEALVLAVNKFIQRDLNFKTGPAYLCAASEYNDERLLESSRRLCAENFEQIDMRELIRLPLCLFRVVVRCLESFERDNKSLSCFLSEVVCRYLEKHQKEINGELLLELTDSLVMPYIAPEAAIGFTSLIKELKTENAEKHFHALSNLSRRCAQSVVKEYGWTDFSVSAAVDEYLGHSKDFKFDDHEGWRVDSLLFATSFAAALEQAQDDYEEVLVEQERLSCMVGALHQTVSMMEVLNSKKDEHMTKQQRAIDEAKKQILGLKDQISMISQQQLQRTSIYPALYEQTDTEIQMGSSLDFRHEKEHRDAPPPLLSYSEETWSPVKDLVSPCQVGLDVQQNKSRRKQELRTKAEMRSRSMLV